MANEQLIKALDATREIQITVTGRKTARPITLPVWFVRDGDRLYLVPVNGSDTAWYKNVLKEPTIRLAAGDAQITARVTPMTDPARVGEIVEAHRSLAGRKGDGRRRDAILAFLIAGGIALAPHLRQFVFRR